MKKNKFSTSSFPVDEMSLYVVYEDRNKDPYFLVVGSYDYLKERKNRDKVTDKLEIEINVIKDKKRHFARDRKRNYKQLGREKKWLRQYLAGDSWDTIAETEGQDENYSLDENSRNRPPSESQIRRAVYDYCKHLPGRQFSIQTDIVNLKVGRESTRNVSGFRRAFQLESKVGKMLELNGTIGHLGKLFDSPGQNICAMMRSIADYLIGHPKEKKPVQEVQREYKKNAIYRMLLRDHKLDLREFDWLYEQTLRLLSKKT